MYDIDAVFSKSRATGQLSEFHLKIMALKKELKNNCESVDATFNGAIEISLPILSLYRLLKPISIFGGNRSYGSMILMADLMKHHTV